MALLQDLSRALERAKRVGLLIHERPDGDAVGSATALALALGSSKKVEIICATPIATIFHGVLADQPVKSELHMNDYDTLIILDCGELHRTGFGPLLRTRPDGLTVIVIDHHRTGNLQKLANYYLGDPEASSTAELVASCLQTMRAAMTQPIAQALLVGLYTDTGGFQHPNTSSRALRVASRLISFGANLPQISQTFFRHRSVKQTKLWGLVLADLRINRLGIAVGRVSRAQLQEVRATGQDVAGLVNLLALVTEARAALLLTETAAGWQGSLRTRHAHIDLGRLARYFGGRGHKKAAGFSVTID